MDIKDYEKIIGLLHKKECEKDWDEDAGASVLIPLMEHDGNVQIVFEKRALDLTHQPGEICLPGGKREGTETLEQNAIRETAEELLVSPSQIQMIAKLPPLVGPGMHRIGVFVGILHDYSFTFDPVEVDSIHLIPLQWLLENEPKGYELKMITEVPDDFPFEKIPHGRNYPWKVGHRTVYFYEHPKVNLWGFSANVVRLFIRELQPLCNPHNRDNIN